MWRGDAFAGFDTPWLNAQRERLQHQRQTAEADLFELRLRAGRHAELVETLTVRTARHPLDERLAGQLMLALYRSGRQADALQRYRRIRRQLVEELGTDPGASLQALHRQILAGAAEVTAPPPVPRPDAGPELQVPRQLPPRPPRFTGRAAELARLTAAVDESAGPGAAVCTSSSSSGRRALRRLADSVTSRPR
ncbi:AfsR/SARP family transcriptional regulator [Microbispora sp. CA-135349]|uniref:AfsR/SARP family transcriptional regulator n=1 Tax=Microbispora sp. CA-135349 TaxID=3239953 RepID=UPI003D90B6C3